MKCLFAVLLLKYFAIVLGTILPFFYSPSMLLEDLGMVVVSDSVCLCEFSNRALLDRIENIGRSGLLDQCLVLAEVIGISSSTTLAPQSLEQIDIEDMHDGRIYSLRRQ